MLTLICGLPRAGKTTYSKRFEDKCKVIHTDTSGVNGAICAVGEIGEQDVVVEGVWRSVDLREKLLQSYNGNGTRCIWINTPVEIRSQRDGYDAISDTPFDPPTANEGWDEFIITTDVNQLDQII